MQALRLPQPWFGGPATAQPGTNLGVILPSAGCMDTQNTRVVFWDGPGRLHPDLLRRTEGPGKESREQNVL